MEYNCSTKRLMEGWYFMEQYGKFVSLWFYYYTHIFDNSSYIRSLWAIWVPHLCSLIGVKIFLRPCSVKAGYHSKTSDLGTHTNTVNSIPVSEQYFFLNQFYKIHYNKNKLHITVQIFWFIFQLLREPSLCNVKFSCVSLWRVTLDSLDLGRGMLHAYWLTDADVIYSLGIEIL